MNGTDIHELKAIVDWASTTSEVRELSLKVGDIELFISKNEQTLRAPGVGSDTNVTQAPPLPSTAEPAAIATPAAAASAPVSTTSPAAPSAGSEPGELTLASDEVVVKSPMVGTFYASPQPGAPTFVSVGDTVQPETVTCIVEVMKLMNNVEAGVHGTIVKILAENESAVEFGQPLFVIQKS